MKYRGRVRNGVVVFNKPNGLADGTVVTVEPTRPANGRNGSGGRTNPKPGTMGAILRHAGTWVGEPGEMEGLLDELRQMKQAEVAAQRAALGLSTPRNGTTKRSANKRTRRA
jgi:hypothetical protein